MRKKRRLSQQDLRAMGATPGRLATRYTPDGRAEVRQLTTYAGRPSLFLSDKSNKRSANKCSPPMREGER
jgi:hypothetical protein